MSKSRGNYIGFTEAPNEQFGMVMSISDETLIQWVNLVTDWPQGDVVAFRRRAESGELHPMEAKKQLAHHLVSLYHGVRAAGEAQAVFENTHQRGLVPDDVVQISIAFPLGIVDALVAICAANSKSVYLTTESVQILVHLLYDPSTHLRPLRQRRHQTRHCRTSS